MELELIDHERRIVERGINLCLIADTIISAACAARELDALVRIYGMPACTLGDNGAGFTARQSCNEQRRMVSNGITSTQANRSRMPL